MRWKNVFVFPTLHSKVSFVFGRRDQVTDRVVFPNEHPWK